MWIYIQSIIVYLLIAWVMYISGKKYEATGKFSYVVWGIAFYAFIFALRYGVGGDFFAYKLAFEELINNTTPYYTERMEIGFVTLAKVFSVFKSTCLIFGVVAFLQLFLIVYNLREIKYAYPLVFLAFMLTAQWLAYANILRQVISVGLWLCAIQFALKRKPVFFYGLIALSISFHNSAVVLVPMYPLIILKEEWFKSVKLQLSLLAVSIVLMNINVVQQLFANLNNVVAFMGYSHYVDNYGEKIDDTVHIGVGFYLLMACNVLVIMYSNKVKGYVKSSYYTVLYNFYFIGVLVNYVFVTSQLMTRMNYFFMSFNFIFIGLTLYYLKANKKMIPYILLLLAVVLTFVATMYRADTNWALFVFDWQDEYYYLHNLHMK